jgi:hypothetical protein
MKKINNLLPFDVICGAASGDSIAIEQVINHYSGYIAKLSMRTVYDENGNQHNVVDEDIRRRLETKLASAILQFRVA